MPPNGPRGGPPGLDPPDIQLEACKNARTLAHLCDLLEYMGGGRDVDRNGVVCPPSSHVLEHDQDVELNRDYDPDVDGWPWETDHL